MDRPQRLSIIAWCGVFVVSIVVGCAQQHQWNGPTRHGGTIAPSPYGTQPYGPQPYGLQPGGVITPGSGGGPVPNQFGPYPPAGSPPGSGSGSY